MNIGEAARRSRLPTKTIRYYENVDLISSTRRPNGFREYDARWRYPEQLNLRGAQVLGMAIGLNLLLGIPLLWGVAITFFGLSKLGGWGEMQAILSETPERFALWLIQKRSKDFRVQE